MFKRRRFEQISSLAERLTENVERLREQLARTPYGPDRHMLLKRIRQSETASHIEEWLRSPGLQPPTGVNRGGKVV